MPWNGCKFEGDPKTPAELLGKAGVVKRSLLKTFYGAEFIVGERIGAERDTNLSRYANSNTVPFLYSGSEADIPLNTYVGIEECGVCEKWTDRVAGGGCKISGSNYAASISKDIPIKPCETKVLNYYGEDLDPETPEGQARIDSLTKNGEISLRVISTVLKLASFGNSEFAKNDYRKDVQGAKTKFTQGRAGLEAGYAEMGRISVPAVELGTKLDVLSAELATLEKSIFISRDKINNFIQQLDTLGNTLSVQNSVKANAESNLANAKTLQERIYWQGIVSQARRDILNTRRDIFKVGNENVAESIIHNDLGAQGMAVSKEILVLQPAIESIKQQAQVTSAKMVQSQSKMNEASKDVGNAQNTFGDKIEFSVNLAQGADGAEGIANGLQAINAKDYYGATAQFLKAGVGQAGYYIPIGPYTKMINLCLDEIFRTAGAGGNIGNFVYRFLDASIALSAQERLANDVSNSVDAIERGGAGEMDAWFGLAKSSGDGIRIIGQWAEVSAPFTGGVIAQPLIKPATQIASDSVSGLLATCVAMGSRDAFFGKCTPGYRDPRSTCGRPESDGPMPMWTLGLRGMYESLFNGPRKNSIEIFKGAFGQQVTEVDTAEIIKQLAKAGGDQLFSEVPLMRVDVSLRPTKPTNTPGMQPPGDYSGRLIYQPEEWDQKQNITDEGQ